MGRPMKSGLDGRRCWSGVVLKTVVSCVICATTIAGPSAAVVGAEAPVAVSSGPYQLNQKDGGEHEITITVTNASANSVDVELATADNERGCEIAASPAEVDARRATPVKFTLSDGCDIGDPTTSLVLAITGTDIAETVDVEAKSPEKDDPRFAVLWWYGLGIGVGALLTVYLYRNWVSGKLAPELHRTPPERLDDESEDDYQKRRAEALTPPQRCFWAPMPGLAKDWSFKDSWASNIGLGAAIFTALLGASDLLEKILGDGHDDKIAVAVVSAAISAAWIAVAPLALSIFKRPSKVSKDRAHNTAGGVVFATAIVLSASIGQILVLTAVFWDSEPLHRAVVLATGAVATLVITLYAAKTVPLTLTAGIQAPKEDPSVVHAIDRVARAIALSAKAGARDLQTRSVPSYADLDALLEGLPETSPGDDPAETLWEFAAMP